MIYDDGLISFLFMFWCFCCLNQFLRLVVNVGAPKNITKKMDKINTDGVMKTVPSVNILFNNTMYLFIYLFTDSLGSRF